MRVGEGREINSRCCFWNSRLGFFRVDQVAFALGGGAAARARRSAHGDPMESDSTKPDPAPHARPTLQTRSSSGSSADLSTPPLSPSQLSPTQNPTAFPFRATGYIPSPMGSVVASKRTRQSSLSSNVSSAPTDATSLDEAEEDCLEEEQDVGHLRRSSSSGRIAGQKARTGQHSSTELHNHSAASLPAATSHSTSPPTTAIPISISTNVAAVRLSTTPLFPSPLAQASGPHEEVEHFKGDDGDESEEEPDTRTGRRRTATMEDSPLRRESHTLFGGQLIIPDPYIARTVC